MGVVVLEGWVVFIVEEVVEKVKELNFVVYVVKV